MEDKKQELGNQEERSQRSSKESTVLVPTERKKVDFSEITKTLEKQQHEPLFIELEREVTQWKQQASDNLGIALTYLQKRENINSKLLYLEEGNDTHYLSNGMIDFNVTNYRIESGIPHITTASRYSVTTKRLSSFVPSIKAQNLYERVNSFPNKEMGEKIDVDQFYTHLNDQLAASELLAGFELGERRLFGVPTASDLEQMTDLHLCALDFYGKPREIQEDLGHKALAIGDRERLIIASYVFNKAEDVEGLFEVAKMAAYKLKSSAIRDTAMARGELLQAEVDNLPQQVSTLLGLTKSMSPKYLEPVATELAEKFLAQECTERNVKLAIDCYKAVGNEEGVVQCYQHVVHHKDFSLAKKITDYM